MAQWKLDGYITRCTLLISTGENERGGVDTYLGKTLLQLVGTEESFSLVDYQVYTTENRMNKKNDLAGKYL